jgi:malate synthase
VLLAPFQSPYITFAKMASVSPDMKKYSTAVPENVNIIPQLEAQQQQLLTKECLEFLAKLHINFESTRQKLLAARVKRQEELNAGAQLNFLESTKDIREKSWEISPLPAPMLKRRVEITGPVDRKMVINALNSGADCYMADFEDSNTPTWTNQLNGQINLIDAIRRKVDFTAENGKEYKLNENVATLLVRPRGWHLDEKHIAINGQRISGSLFDFGVYFYHNAKELLNRGLGPFYYLPKLENHLEARLWNDVFVFAEKELSVPSGSIKATVLIETIVAAFEMEEILYELRDHSAGLNAGRWDYIFSCIKRFQNKKDLCFSDRKLITMASPFMRAYALLLVKTCHKRNAPAIGGMSALIPIKNDPAANEKALGGVREDKARDAVDGFDGGWVAHPGLVSLAMTEITKVLGDKPNQITKQRPDVNVSAKDLLNFQPNSPITENGLRLNISVGIQYLAAWLTGTGCVPIMNLMEDAATAEISRSQIWQWINSSNGVLEDGRKVTKDLVKSLLQEELQRLKAANTKLPYDKAAQIFEQMSISSKMEEFLTLPLYESF